MCTYIIHVHPAHTCTHAHAIVTASWKNYMFAVFIHSLCCFLSVLFFPGERSSHSVSQTGFALTPHISLLSLGTQKALCISHCSLSSKVHLVRNLRRVMKMKHHNPILLLPPLGQHKEPEELKGTSAPCHYPAMCRPICHHISVSSSLSVQ